MVFDEAEKLDFDNLYPSNMGEILVSLADVRPLPLPSIEVEELNVEVISEARYLPLPE